jgi:hypothetical protein
MSNPWNPGSFAQFPWTAFAALLGAIGGVAGSAAVLIVSDGIAITEWTFQPTVYLSIISTITNIMVRYALARGLTTAWWARALKANTKISDLHQLWKTGNSVLAALTIGGNFNFVTLASVLVAISPINGPLLQRASRVAIVYVQSGLTLSIALAPRVPTGYTGIIEGRGYTPSFFMQDFTPVVNSFYDRLAIQIKNTSCIGTCSMTVVGAGFAVNCSSYETNFNLTIYAPPNTTYNSNQSLVTEGVDLFQSTINWSPYDPGNLHTAVQFKPDATCNISRLIVRNCTLRPATVQYNAVIDGNQSTISLLANSTIYDDAIQSLYNIQESYQSGDNSTLGGFYLALANRFNSWANVKWAGAIGYYLLTSGVTANQFIDSNSTASSAHLENFCNMSFGDPTDSLLANARELMFRTAIAAANSSDIQSMPAIQVASVALYQSHYLYLALASGFTLLSIILVIPTFSGYWNLGRKVSMSPIEIAKAFNAPISRQADSNAEAEQLIKGLGEIDVRYGVVSTGTEIDDSDRFKQGVLYTETDISRRRLEIAPSQLVTKPEKGYVYAG